MTLAQRQPLLLLWILLAGCHVILPLDEHRDDAGRIDLSGAELEMRAADLRADVLAGEGPLALDGSITCGGIKVIEPAKVIQRSDRAGAVLPDGTVHTAYGTAQGLKHATNASGGWVIEMVDPTPDAGQDAALAVDIYGGVHVLYRAKGEIRWAHKEKAWTVKAIDSGAEGYTSLAADSSGLHASFRRTGSLWYAHLPKGSGTWTGPKHIANPGGWDSSIAVRNGQVHIAHGTSSPNSELRYSRMSGGVWQAAKPRGGQPNVGVDVSVAVDGKGIVFIAHHERSLGQLLLTTGVSGTWAQQTLDQGPDAGSFPSIAIHGGVPHIVYRRFGNQQLVYLRLAGSKWVSTVVDARPSGGPLGQYPFLGVDGSGRVHVTYAGASGELLYAMLCP